MPRILLRLSLPQSICESILMLMLMTIITIVLFKIEYNGITLFMYIPMRSKVVFPILVTVLPRMLHPIPRVPDSVGPVSGHRACISIKFSGYEDATGLGTTTL